MSCHRTEEILEALRSRGFGDLLRDPHVEVCKECRDSLVAVRALERDAEALRERLAGAPVAADAIFQRAAREEAVARTAAALRPLALVERSSFILLGITLLGVVLLLIPQTGSLPELPVGVVTAPGGEVSITDASFLMVSIVIAACGLFAFGGGGQGDRLLP